MMNEQIWVKENVLFRKAARLFALLKFTTLSLKKNHHDETEKRRSANFTLPGVRHNDALCGLFVN